MFELSFAELLVIGVVALLVLGPDELPNALRAVMRFFKSLRRLVEEVQVGVTSLAEEPEVKEFTHAIKAERRYIIDEAGNHQEVFDISDLMQDDKKPSQP